MNIVRRIKIFVSLDSKTMLLYLEAFFCLGWARWLKSMPFSKVAPSLGEKMNDTTFTTTQSNREIMKHISHAIQITSKYTIWESQCLVKAIAAMRMLQKRQIESTLYLGTAKDETGKMIAHAWLRSGSFYVTGSDGMGRFTVVAKFANRLEQRAKRGVL
jgi:signal recognition particle GTPase